MVDLNKISLNETEQKEFSLIPNNTVVRACITINAGGETVEEFSQFPFFKKSQTTAAKWLPLELYVIGGEYDQQKFWHNLFVDGDARNEDGVSKSREIGLRTLRKIVDSIYGLKASDQSEDAMAKRNIPNIDILVDKEFCFLVGIEKGTNGYADKNRMILPLTPDDSRYIGGTQGVVNNPQIAKSNSATASAPKSNVPEWAQ